MVWGRVFGQKIKIPAKIVRYREGKRKLVIDLRLMARSCHSSMIYLLWMYSHFMAPEICHWIFKMNGSFPPFLPSWFSLSPFFISHLFLCWSDCYLEMFQKSCLWSTFLLMVPESSGHLAASLSTFSVGKGAAVLFCTWILVTGSRWTCPSVVQLQGCDRAHSSCVSKLLTKAEVCLKSPWLEETQVGRCWSHTQSALPGHLGSESEDGMCVLGKSHSPDDCANNLPLPSVTRSWTPLWGPVFIYSLYSVVFIVWPWQHGLASTVTHVTQLQPIHRITLAV